jgi:HPt (histidine-containing phosphotransfer) domain-containing protein
MILDKQAALDRIDNDEELYLEIIGIFRSDVPEILSRLKAEVGAGNLQDATRSAHSLKSTAASIGAVELSETAKQAEDSLRAGEGEKIGMLIEQIDQKLAAVMCELSESGLCI